MKKMSLTIHGFVQGVFYRKSTQEEALKLGLVGCVKNNDDGTVAITAVGKQKDLKKLLDWCHSGPVSAKIDRIDVDWSDQLDEYDGFEIVR